MKTRQPSGRPAFPLILVEGQEKAGKSFTLAQLSASKYVDQTFLFDLGDGTLDEYATLGPYTLVDTDGTYSDLLASVKEACQEKPADGKVNVVGIDCGTDLWDLLKKWADTRARESKSGRKALADDPDAAIDTSMNLWNDAKDRWAAIINQLRRFPGIGVITAQGDEVTEVVNGVPTRGTTWTVRAEKTIPAAANAWVRLQRDPRKATLIGVRRLGVDVPKGGLPLPLENTLEHLVFDVLGGSEGFGPLAVKAMTLDPPVPASHAKQDILRRIQQDNDMSDDDAKAVAMDVWEWGGITSDEVTSSELEDLLERIPTAVANR
jgi:hypothetical protein